jgi:hypothetical protein
MSRSSLELHLDELRSVSRQVYSAVTNGSLEQRARYRELRTELDRLEQEVAANGSTEQLSDQARGLLAAFERFQRRIEPGDYAAA